MDAWGEVPGSAAQGRRVQHACTTTEVPCPLFCVPLWAHLLPAATQIERAQMAFERMSKFAALWRRRRTGRLPSRRRAPARRHPVVATSTAVSHHPLAGNADAPADVAVAAMPSVPRIPAPAVLPPRREPIASPVQLPPPPAAVPLPTPYERRPPRNPFADELRRQREAGGFVDGIAAGALASATEPPLGERPAETPPHAGGATRRPPRTPLLSPPPRDPRDASGVVPESVASGRALWPVRAVEGAGNWQHAGYGTIPPAMPPVPAQAAVSMPVAPAPTLAPAPALASTPPAPT